MNIGQLSESQLKDVAAKSLAAWKTKFDAGEIKFNVINQFDLTKYESAINNLNKISRKELNELGTKLSSVRLDSMTSHDWFNHLSTFESPEISRGWVD